MLTLPPGSTYDVATFDILAAAALDPAHGLRDRRRRDAAEQAISLYKDDYLTSISAGWVLPMRMRLRGLLIDLLLFLTRSWRATGEPARAIDYARRAVAADPLEERAQRALVEACMANGDMGAAMSAYASYRDLLAAELGQRPSAALQALGRRLSGHATPARSHERHG